MKKIGKKGDVRGRQFYEIESCDAAAVPLDGLWFSSRVKAVDNILFRQRLDAYNALSDEEKLIRSSYSRMNSVTTR